jgi:uncharacterized protein (DUF1501 family)
MNRRDFLTGLSLVPLVGYAGKLASAPAGRYDRLLILIELKGGSDGLNMAVPYADAAYYRLRPNLAVERGQVQQLSESTGLHLALSPLMPLWEAGELALLQGVGYAQPNFSHFRSIEIWDTAAASNEYLRDGWLARSFEQFRPPLTFAADGIAIGDSELGPFAGIRTRSVALADAQEFAASAGLVEINVASNAAVSDIVSLRNTTVDAAGTRYPFATEFPAHAFGRSIQTACEVIAGETEVAALRITLNGFDTHSNQRRAETRLLQELAQALASLKAGLIEIDRWNSTLIMTYSEFGRLAKENPAGGTDHGSTNTYFALGGAVKGGLYGEPPALNRLDGEGNLAFAIDFRRLYATVLETWWGVPSSPILGERFAALDLLRHMA